MHISCHNENKTMSREKHNIRTDLENNRIWKVKYILWNRLRVSRIRNIKPGRLEPEVIWLLVQSIRLVKTQTLVRPICIKQCRIPASGPSGDCYAPPRWPSAPSILGKWNQGLKDKISWTTNIRTVPQVLSAISKQTFEKL